VNCRTFFERTAILGATSIATWRPEGLTRVLEASASVAQRASDDVARDKTYWREIQ
jgi:hypothetical protein